MINEIIKKISTKFSVTIVTEEPYSSMPKDIDILAKKNDRLELDKLLVDNDFVLDKQKYITQARRCIGGNVYMLDILYDLRYFQNFQKVDFDNETIEQNNFGKEFYQFIKYILIFPKTNSALNYINQNWERFYDKFFNGNFVTNQPYRKIFNKKEFIFLLNHPFIGRIVLTKIDALLYSCKCYFFNKIENFKKGKLIAVVGADGSGKTTLVDKLAIAVPAKVIYMGDYNYRLQKFYNFLHAKNIWVARLSYIPMFIENWFRYISAIFLKIRGFVVVFDRFPGMNRQLRNKNIWLKINDIIYDNFFPSADFYIMTYADPEVIYKRKQELSIVETEILQENMMNKLIEHPHILLETNSIDITVNKALASIYKMYEK